MLWTNLVSCQKTLDSCVSLFDPVNDFIKKPVPIVNKIVLPINLILYDLVEIYIDMNTINIRTIIHTAHIGLIFIFYKVQNK